MSLRDNAIVAYAETKVMEKSDRDVLVLAGEILEELLDKTGVRERAKSTAWCMAGLTGTGAAIRSGRRPRPTCWASMSASASRFTPAAARLRDAVVRAAAAIDVWHVRRCASCCSPTRTCCEDKTDQSHNYRREWTEPYGLMGPPGAFGLLSRAYEAKYGLDYRMLGKLAVTQRNHALLNENACEKLRVPITVDDYLNSRIIADPIRLLDCVMRADGAAGLIMMSRKRAKQKGLTKCIIPIGYAERTNFKGGENLVDVTKSGHEICGKKALGEAGLSIKDIASFHPYDDFIIAIMHAVRGLRLLQAGRRRAVHPRPRLLLQRRSAAQHRRRADFCRPSRVLLA